MRSLRHPRAQRPAWLLTDAAHYSRVTNTSQSGTNRRALFCRGSFREKLNHNRFLRDVRAEEECRYNSAMSASPHSRRIQRAQELIERHPFARQILEFYIRVAHFQDHFYRRLEKKHSGSSTLSELNPEDPRAFAAQFESFLAMVESHGPAASVEAARQLRSQDAARRTELLRAAWTDLSPSQASGFLAQAFLQPYAELRRSGNSLTPEQSRYATCPFCHRKPCLGVLRQLGEGAARSLVCSFCLTEWDFRRLVCPGCGEENDSKLPVFTAEDFPHIRVECCETCKTYIKTIDLTKNGRADPLVDELASATLDLWAQEHGYAKLHPNLLGM